MVALGAASVTLAACGGSGVRSATKPGADNSPIALSKCMRAHGVSAFPDPTTGPGGPGLSLEASSGGQVTINGISMGGPAFEKAAKACSMFPGGGAGPQISEQQRLQMLALARCMRANGVPNFPDPKFSTSSAGVAKLSSRGPNGLAPNSPALQHAISVCRNR